ncbi:MAG TPA: DinB family protein [Patescibacteria group bacterium]|nr:DinB family protein [Patescibacteria group bacterium]
MYRKLDDFYTDWKFESEATLKVLKNLSDDALNHAVTEEGRTVGDIAWHLVLTLGEMPKRAGLPIDAPEESSEIPLAQEISETYALASVSLESELKKNWKDENLSEKVNMYGEEWPKGTVLSTLIMHQAHHRGQLTILMRQAGLRVPGVYGPSREEWELMGLPPMK